MNCIRHAVVVVITYVAATVAQAAGVVGSTLPPGFPVIEDTSLAAPVIGFGETTPKHAHSSFFYLSYFALLPPRASVSPRGRDRPMEPLDCRQRRYEWMSIGFSFIASYFFTPTSNCICAPLVISKFLLLRRSRFCIINEKRFCTNVRTQP